MIFSFDFNHAETWELLTLNWSVTEIAFSSFSTAANNFAFNLIVTDLLFFWPRLRSTFGFLATAVQSFPCSPSLISTSLLFFPYSFPSSLYSIVPFSWFLSSYILKSFRLLMHKGSFFLFHLFWEFTFKMKAKPLLIQKNVHILDIPSLVANQILCLEC